MLLLVAPQASSQVVELAAADQAVRTGAGGDPSCLCGRVRPGRSGAAGVVDVFVCGRQQGPRLGAQRFRLIQEGVLLRSHQSIPRMKNVERPNTAQACRKTPLGS